MSDKVDFKPKLVSRDKEGLFILINRKNISREVTIINLFVPTLSTPNFIKHTLTQLKTQIDPSTVVVGDFNTTLSPIDRSPRQKNQ
jgi:hypothetical protein